MKQNGWEGDSAVTEHDAARPNGDRCGVLTIGGKPMIIVDNALKAREAAGQPIRVGMVGAGFMGQGLTNQITHSVPGMRMAAIYNRHGPSGREQVYPLLGLRRRGQRGLPGRAGRQPIGPGGRPWPTIRS